MMVPLHQFFSIHLIVSPSIPSLLISSILNLTINPVLFCGFSYIICVLVAQLCLTLCYPMDCSLPGSSCPWNSPGKNTRGVAIPFSRGSSWPREQTWVSCIAGRFFTIWDTVEPPLYYILEIFISHPFMCLLIHLFWLNIYYAAIRY